MARNMTRTEVIKVLIDNGGTFLRKSRGHYLVKMPAGAVCSVPEGDLADGTLSKIIRTSGVSRKAFE